MVGEMDIEDPVVVTRTLAEEFSEFVAKLSSEEKVCLTSELKNIDGHGEKVNQGEIDTKLKSTVSYASITGKQNTKSSVQIKKMHSSEAVEGANVVIPMEVVEEVSSRFANTLYGYFIGKRLAFPLVENYVKNTWAKFGLKRVMLDGDFFLFQFDSKQGMDRVIEAGPWLIRKLPLILNVWSPTADLKKDEIRSVPVWVKLYNVPIVAYSEAGLSLITTQIGTPIMLDEYTSNMCLKSWGRKEYARALIEISAEVDIMDNMVVAIPRIGGKEHSLVSINIEYEWKPPRCSTCKIFDHKTDVCPRSIKVVADPKGDKDGFIAASKGKKKDIQVKQIEGVRLTKSKPIIQYRRIEKGMNSSSGQHNKGVDKSNKFSVLANTGVDLCDLDSVKELLTVLNESDSDEDELIMEDEDGVNIGASDLKGASTPSIAVDHD